jgi:hypothetical protein
MRLRRNWAAGIAYSERHVNSSSGSERSCAGSGNAPSRSRIPDTAVRSSFSLTSLTYRLTSIHRNFNNTFVFDSSGLCDANTSPIQCLGRNGGAFAEFSSTTWQPLPQSTDDHTKELPSFNVTADIFGLETLQLNSSVSTTKFPIHIPRNRNILDMNSIGLGRNSTILNALFNSGVIASRSWSVFGGLMGADSIHQMDGNLVFGGYDTAKFTGDNYTERIVDNRACPTSLVATVVDISIMASGQPLSLLGQQLGSAVRFCVDPAYPIITIPEDAGSIFRDNSTTAQELGRAFGLNLFGLLYDADSAYVKGSLQDRSSNMAAVTRAI